jgi:hypothetical protein
MVKAMKFIFILLIATFVFSSCAHKMVGTWMVDKYQISLPGRQPIVQENIGQLKFKKKGQGEKELLYKDFLGNNKMDKTDFGWFATGFYIGVESPNSEFSQTWASYFNKKKQQKWKATDERGVIRVIEMHKK